MALVLAGCGGQEPSAPPPATTTNTTTTTTTPEPDRPATMADLAKDPCAALTEDNAAALGVVAGGDEPDPTDPEACSWVAAPTIVMFKAYPATDVVPEYAAKPGAVPLTVGGQPATQITVETSCFTHVTVAASQSFRVAASGDAGDPCQATVNFATAILANLT